MDIYRELLRQQSKSRLTFYRLEKASIAYLRYLKLAISDGASEDVKTEIRATAKRTADLAQKARMIKNELSLDIAVMRDGRTKYLLK